MKNIVLAMATEGIDMKMLSVAEDKIIEAIEETDSMHSGKPNKITCDYQDSVLSACMRSKADALIISEKLPGIKDITEVIKEVKSSIPSITIIVLLIKPRDIGDLMLAKLVMLGVYNWLPSPWKPHEIAKLVSSPKQLNDVDQYMPKLVENEGNIAMVIPSTTLKDSQADKGKGNVVHLDALNENAAERQDLNDLLTASKVAHNDNKAKSYNGMFTNSGSLFSQPTSPSRVIEVESKGVSFAINREEEIKQLIEDLKASQTKPQTDPEIVRVSSADDQAEPLNDLEDIQTPIVKADETEMFDLSMDRTEEQKAYRSLFDNSLDNSFINKESKVVGNVDDIKTEEIVFNETIEVAKGEDKIEEPKKEPSNKITNLHEFVNNTSQQTIPETKHTTIQSMDTDLISRLQQAVALNNGVVIDPEGKVNETSNNKEENLGKVFEEAKDNAVKETQENTVVKPKEKTLEKTEVEVNKDKENKQSENPNNTLLVNELIKASEGAQNFLDVIHNYASLHNDEMIKRSEKRCLNKMRRASNKRHASTIWDAFIPDPSIQNILCLSILPIKPSVPIFLTQAYRKKGMEVDLIDLTRDRLLLNHTDRTKVLDGVLTYCSTFNDLKIDKRENSVKIMYAVAGHGVEKVINQADKIIVIAPDDSLVIDKFIRNYGDMIRYRHNIFVIEPAVSYTTLNKVLHPLKDNGFADLVACICCTNIATENNMLTGKLYHTLIEETNLYIDSIEYVAQALLILTGLIKRKEKNGREGE